MEFSWFSFIIFDFFISSSVSFFSFHFFCFLDTDYDESVYRIVWNSVEGFL
jgi:hypothetical protein